MRQNATMKATSPRRQLAMCVLLGLALVGAGIRHWADNPSTLRDVGTLMLVLWLPAVGNLVGFVIREFPGWNQRFRAMRRPPPP